MHGVCWIKNHVQVPDDYVAQKDMAKGLQPKVPAKYCAFPDDLTPLQAERLEVVWGADGIFAALYEGDELICAVPYWVDQNFVGYSKYSCNTEAPEVPFALGNAESNAMFKRAQDARAFWQQDFNRIWNSYQEAYLTELESKYDKHLKYYAIDGDDFPAKAIATFEKDGAKYAFTIGVGMFPQPNESQPFIELGFRYPDEDFDELAALSKISSIVTIPWAFNTYFGHGHTVDFEVNDRYKVAMLSLDEDKVNLLWLLPVITPTS